MDGPPTPFSYDDYEAYFRTPEIGNIDDALSGPEISPDTNFPSGYDGAPYNANPRVDWTYSEKEIFQITLTERGFSHPRLFEEISARIPGKTADQVKEHFDALVQAGHIQIPVQETEGATNSGGTSQGRQKWTDEEHALFLRGLAQYGKGEWKRISSDFVITKTPSQVSSHAQKYFKRINNTTPPLRRRFSINDTRIVDSTIIHYPARPL